MADAECVLFAQPGLHGDIERLAAAGIEVVAFASLDQLELAVAVHGRRQGIVVPVHSGRPARAYRELGDLTDPANQARCYRYRVFETVVPLRNVIWRLEP